jgi:hypothetical protein
MNKAQIVRDNNGKVYLKVEGKPLDKAICFKIDEFVTYPKGKIIELSKSFLIDLNAQEE